MFLIVVILFYLSFHFSFPSPSNENFSPSLDTCIIAFCDNSGMAFCDNRNIIFLRSLPGSDRRKRCLHVYSDTLLGSAMLPPSIDDGWRKNIYRIFSPCYYTGSHFFLFFNLNISITILCFHFIHTYLFTKGIAQINMPFMNNFFLTNLNTILIVLYYSCFVCVCLL